MYSGRLVCDAGVAMLRGFRSDQRRSRAWPAPTKLPPVGAGHARDKGPELVAIAPMGRSYKSTTSTSVVRTTCRSGPGISERLVIDKRMLHFVRPRDFWAGWAQSRAVDYRGRSDVYSGRLGCDAGVAMLRGFRSDQRFSRAGARSYRWECRSVNGSTSLLSFVGAVSCRELFAYRPTGSRQDAAPARNVTFSAAFSALHLHHYTAREIPLTLHRCVLVPRCNC